MVEKWINEDEINMIISELEGFEEGENEMKKIDLSENKQLCELLLQERKQRFFIKKIEDCISINDQYLYETFKQDCVKAAYLDWKVWEELEKIYPEMKGEICQINNRVLIIKDDKE